MNPDITIKQFRSNAKLMITGEYLVLRGAESLAIPLKYGQTLKVTEHTGIPSLVWKTYINGKHWFEAVFSLEGFAIGNSNDFIIAQFLREILLAAKKMNPAFLEKNVRFEAVSELDFDINWGLGSSSSLIANISKWAEVDPFDLFSHVSSGSGYDMAAAISDAPVLFRVTGGTRNFTTTEFYPVFHEKVYFAWLGKKRNSAQAVNKFSEMDGKDLTREVSEISSITRDILACRELREFRRLIREHERIISEVLKVPPLGEKLFSDFNGDVKSLGAWGGDFILLASDMPDDYIVSYLKKKDLNIWFHFNELIIKP